MCCGAQEVNWTVLDRLYLTLKTFEDASCSAHMNKVMSFLQSSAASAFTIVWQRAHWRHPDTPSPALQTLIDIFQDWQCSDVRDNVYALVGMASLDTVVEPNYFLSSAQLYREVLKGEARNSRAFCTLLAQLLALPAKDIGLDQHDL